MIKKFKDDVIVHIKNDIIKIQIKPTLYISNGGEKGSGHLCKEGLNNAIDECLSENGIGDTITVHYDEEPDTMDISDDSRGIPFNVPNDPMMKSCTLIQAGSKHSRDVGGSSAGENGIGMTAMNALSEMFCMTSYRGKECRIIKFRNGELTQDKIQKLKNEKTGLTVSIKPSKTFLGPEAKIPIDYIEEWLQKISFVLPENITIKFSTKRLDPSKNVTKTFKNKDGLSGYLKTLAPKANLFRTPLVLSDNNSIVEKDVIVQQEDGTSISMDVMRTLDLTIAMNYEPMSQIFDPHSFCNIVENPLHGMHHLGVKQAYLNYIKKQVKDSFTKKESGWDITDSDVLSGLSLVVNLNTTHSTGFSPQTKEFLSNQALLTPIRQTASKMFTDFFRSVDGKKYLTAIIKIVKTNIETRKSMNKAKNKIKANVSFIDERSIKGYTAPNNDGKKDYRELYIVEGESAGGGGRGGRYDNGIQGLLELKGKILNILNRSDAKAVESEDIDKILKVLRCGYDKHYNEDNLYFDKVIIFTDADVDGDHIAALILLLFIMRCPKLIENGHVYRAMTPLYKLQGKTKRDKEGNPIINIDKFKYTKKEFFESFEVEVSKKFKIKVNEDDKFSTSAQMTSFLSVNSEYYDILCTMAAHYSCDKDVLEYMAMNLNTFQDNIKNLDRELSYEDGCISGAYDGNYNHIIINDPMMKQLRKLNKIITDYNNGNGHYYMYEAYAQRGVELRGYMTIGQIMQECKKFEPVIGTRFKGLGELNPEELSELGFNPFNRRLYNISMADAEETVNKFLMLFTDKQMEDKKRLFMEAEVGMEDLDN